MGTGRQRWSWAGRRVTGRSRCSERGRCCTGWWRSSCSGCSPCCSGVPGLCTVTVGGRGQNHKHGYRRQVRRFWSTIKEQMRFLIKSLDDRGHLHVIYSGNEKKRSEFTQENKWTVTLPSILKTILTGGMENLHGENTWVGARPFVLALPAIHSIPFHL